MLPKPMTARSALMTRRILDRQKLKRAVEDSKRVLERARRAPDLRPPKPSNSPKNVPPKRPLRRQDSSTPHSAGSTPSPRLTIIRSNSAHTPSAPCHCPRVAALEYSVERASKKLACSTPESMDCSQGSGFSLAP